MTPPSTRTQDISGQWYEVGDLALLMEPESLEQLLRDSGVPVQRAECNYIRLKPGVGALLGLDLDIFAADGRTVSLQGYVRTHPAERTAELMQKWHKDRSLPTAVGKGVRLLKGGRTVLFLFPNDARVRGMRYVAEVDKLKRLLLELEDIGGDGWRIRGRKTSLETIRYKPERRLILRVRLGMKNDRTGERRDREVFLRFFADDRGHEIARMRRALEKQPIGRYLPRLLGAASEGRLFVEEAIDGHEILPDVLEGSADPEAIARTLALLHAAEVDGLPRLQLGDMLRTAQESAQNLIIVEPEFKDLLDPILERLHTLRPEQRRPVTLHGDCHLHQFLETERGPRLVDFERAAHGHPMFDLGHLSAHLLILEKREPASAARISEFRQALLQHYGHHSGEAPVEMEQLPFFLGCGLLERALLPFRRLQRDWPQRCRELLELAYESIGAVRLSRTGFFAREEGWEVFYPRTGHQWPGHIKLEGGKKSHGYYDTVIQDFVRSCPEKDPSLPGFRKWHGRGKLISYRHGRRATLMVEDSGETETLFVKLVRPSKVTKIAQRVLAIQDVPKQPTSLFPALPRLLKTEPENGALVFKRMPGQPLHEILMTGETVDLASVAQGLAAFHSLIVAPDSLPQAHEHSALQAWADFVGQHDPNLLEHCLRALQACETLPEGPFGPTDRLVHGDLHDRNILVDGEVIGLLDLDLLGLGDPTHDLGNLAAHFVLRALQRGRSPEVGREQARQLLAAYEGAGGGLVDEGVAAVGAATLFRLGCLYRFRRRWRGLCYDLLAEAQAWARVGLH